MMNQAKGKRSYILQIGIIMAIAVGLGFTLYLPTLLQDTPPQSRTLQTAPGCDLTQSSCSAVSGQQQIQLTINSAKISSAIPLRFEVKLSDIQADQVMLDLKGQDMYMGLNQVMLNKVPGTTDRWQGEATLAVCTTGKMTWISSIIAEHKGNITQADFFFDAY
jgi:hypothetical protein